MEGGLVFFGSRGLAFPLLHIHVLFQHSPLRFILYVFINGGIKIKTRFWSKLSCREHIVSLRTYSINYISFCASNINYVQCCEKVFSPFPNFFYFLHICHT